MRGRGRAIAVLGVVVVALCGCSSESPPLPVVDDIAAAIAAVEAVDDTVMFREVNADTEVVRLFVASSGDSEVVGYLYVEGDLLGPAPPQSVDPGPAFAADAVDLDTDAVFGAILAELDDPEIERFVITAADDGAARYEAFVRSERGGLLAVQLSGDGSVLGVVPR